MIARRGNFVRSVILSERKGLSEDTYCWTDAFCGLTAGNITPRDVRSIVSVPIYCRLP